MFIAVTLPHGIAYLRADRIESVMPIAQSEIDRVTGNNPDSHIHRTMITMISGSDDNEWWVSEDADTIMCDIKDVLEI